MPQIVDPTEGWNKRISFDPADTLDALSDWIRMRGNAPLSEDEVHPCASVFIERGIRLKDIALHLSGVEQAEGAQLTRSLTNSDFQESFGVAMARVLAVAYAAQSKAHRQLMLDVPTKGVRSTELPTVDLSDWEVTSAGTQKVFVEVTEGASAKPKIYSGIVHLSRELLISDDIGAINALLSQLGAATARLEARALASLLDTNGNLADGAPLIGADNTASTTGLSAASLGEAAEILFTVTTASGNVANLTPKFLIVPPSQWVAALAPGSHAGPIRGATNQRYCFGLAHERLLLGSRPCGVRGVRADLPPNMGVRAAIVPRQPRHIRWGQLPA